MADGVAGKRHSKRAKGDVQGCIYPMSMSWTHGKQRVCRILEWDHSLPYRLHYIPPPPPYPNFTTFSPNTHVSDWHLSDLLGIRAVPARLVQGSNGTRRLVIFPWLSPTRAAVQQFLIQHRSGSDLPTKGPRTLTNTRISSPTSHRPPFFAHHLLFESPL